MCVNDQRLKAEIACASIQVAVMLLVLTRMPPACNAENANALSTYDPKSVANARQDCVGDTCCSPPYEIEPGSFWTYAKSKYSCCVPKAKRNKINCCPHPWIPSKEPNMDPGFGPFCCDPQSGHCCSKLNASVNGEPRDIVYSEPIGGECCTAYPNNFLTKCCPRPLSKLSITSPDLAVGSTNQALELCCSYQHPHFCLSTVFNYENVPAPRFCSPREFCCPWPYIPRIQIIKVNNQYVFIDGAPQYNASLDDQCLSPAFQLCTLPQVPWYRSCIEQQFAVQVSQQDTPLYDMIPYEFSNPDPSKTAASSNVQCLKEDVIRRTFGNPFIKPDSHSVAIDWFVTSPYVQRSKLLNETYVREQIWMWPDVIIPFIFPITIVTISLATALPALLLGAICWALVFNFRFLWVKRVRMANRRILVCIEKRRRIIQDNYLPLEDHRKFHARDRYQLPKALQDSDRSEDDEPDDLKRTHIDVIESHWTAEEINALGFDPDNIPLDWIYGDLLDNPSALRKEVKAYNTTAKASGRPMLSEDDEKLKQLDFEEWLHFLSKGETGTKDESAPQGARLERKRSIQRYKTRRKISRRGKVRVRIKPSDILHRSPSIAKAVQRNSTKNRKLTSKPSEILHESPSTSKTSKRKKKKKHKSKSQKKRKDF